MMPPLFLLTGGLATRMYPLTKAIPKAMIDIDGRPFIWHQLELLKQKGIKQVVVCAGYLGEQIQCYLRDGFDLGIEIKYSFDGSSLLGTGGALKKAVDLFVSNEESIFWVMYGDSYLDIDFNPILDKFLLHNKLGMMTVMENNDQWDKSNIHYQDNEIIEYTKNANNPRMKHIDYGLALLRKHSFNDIKGYKNFDLSSLYSNLISQHQMLGFEVEKRFFEIGSFSGLEETKKYIRSLSNKNN